VITLKKSADGWFVYDQGNKKNICEVFDKRQAEHIRDFCEVKYLMLTMEAVNETSFYCRVSTTREKSTRALSTPQSITPSTLQEQTKAN
jgi:hypothetical protein